MPTRPTPRRPTKTAGDVRGCRGARRPRGGAQRPRLGANPLPRLRLRPSPGSGARRQPMSGRDPGTLSSCLRTRSRFGRIRRSFQRLRTKATASSSSSGRSRRALELGLQPGAGTHVFVAAEPEVMIEDDIVRYAQRFAASRPSPPTRSTYTISSIPRPPVRSSCPPGSGRSSSIR